MPYPSQGVKYAHTQKSTPFYAPGQAKPVAFGDFTRRLLFKKFDSEKHLVLKPQKAIAFDVTVMEEAIRLGLLHIQCKDIRTRNVYTATLETFQSKGFSVRRGFGNQWALALDWWSINGRGPVAARDEAIRVAKQEQAGQLALFGGAD